MDWKPGTPLTDGQKVDPVEVIGYLDELRPQVISDVQPLPVMLGIDASWPTRLWGDTKTTRRFKTWGHKDGDKLGAHFICTRGGIGFHTDPGFVRYSVHLELYNEGWWTHGVDENPDGKAMYVPGLVTVLDTWSPHTVTKDPRLTYLGPSKVAAAIDFKDYPESVPDAIDALLDHLPAFALP
jgi:hypothetical protein